MNSLVPMINSCVMRLYIYIYIPLVSLEQIFPLRKILANNCTEQINCCEKEIFYVLV